MEIRDEELFSRAKEGDSEAFSCLFKRYEPVVLTIKKQYYIRSMGTDDWYQEARIIFMHSLNDYDGSYYLTFGSYFKMNFNRHIISILRRQGALKRQSDLTATSWEEVFAHSGDKVLHNGDYVLDRSVQYVIIRDSLSDFSEQLSKFECSVFMRYIRGEPIDSISNKLKCSEARIKNAIDRIKRKLKAHIK